MTPVNLADDYSKNLKAHFAALREKMAQAYDFALDKIGMEIMSYQVDEISIILGLHWLLLPNGLWSFFILLFYFLTDLGGLH